MKFFNVKEDMYGAERIWTISRIDNNIYTGMIEWRGSKEKGGYMFKASIHAAFRSEELLELNEILKSIEGENK